MVSGTSHDADSGGTAEDGRGPTRRRVLGALGVGFAAGLGGCIGGVSGHPRDATDRRYKRSVRVLLGDETADLEVGIPATEYERARESSPAVPEASRAARSADFLDGLAERLHDRTDSPADAVRAAQSLAARLPYATDRESTGEREYVRHPAETLVDERGDCDDVAVLLSALLSRPAFDYRTGLVMPRDHCATLVARADLPTEPAREALTVTLAGVEYVYVEAVQRVRPGDWAQDYGERPLLAAYVDGWHIIDGQALLEAVGEGLDRAAVESAGRYL